MRTKLKILRVQHNLTQEQIAQKLNCLRATYTSIESGNRNGKLTFWENLQSAFNIPDEKMWELMRND